jgi:hypothetical protein
MPSLREMMLQKQQEATEAAKKSDLITKQASPDIGSASNPKVLANLKFLNDFFKANAEYLFSNEQIAAFIEKNTEKFNEVETLCQV